MGANVQAQDQGHLSHAYPDPPQAVYIHIPFCSNKCHYCDFNSYVVHGQPVEDYLVALADEMKATTAEVPPDTIHTIFVGGGTPSILSPAQLERFLNSLRNHFPQWREDVEFTMEANPGTVNLEKLKVMREGGVNRLSFGAQSFNDRILQRIGRIHEAQEIRQSVEWAREAGFNNLSLDLMFGLPEQTLQDLEESLCEALHLGLEHYSVYSLIVEENTLFHTLYERGKLPLPSEEEELAMYETVRERMKISGYPQYEISNFSRPGRESRHNLVYWHNEAYYGLGAGAHGYVQGVRHENARGVTDYIERVKKIGLPRLATRSVERAEAMEDMMMVGMRLMEGVSFGRFSSRFGVPLQEVFAAVLPELAEKGLIELDADGVRLSSKGILHGNEVFAAFLALQES